MLKISEIFCSIQGEGIYTGTPSIFVRFQGCSSHCFWCDSSFGWDKNSGNEMSVEEVFNKICNYKYANHVVITGGESLEQLEGLKSLVELLRYQYFITIETNGTINPCDYLDQFDINMWSISPKLCSAKAKRKYDIEAIKYMIEYKNSQLKFVISDEEDIKEMFKLLQQLELAQYIPIIVQPNGQEKGLTCSAEEYSKRASWLVDILLKEYISYWSKYDIRIMLQQHKVIWGNKRGV